jgi:prepilin-type processing-associated H-X9-DG protein
LRVRRPEEEDGEISAIYTIALAALVIAGALSLGIFLLGSAIGRRAGAAATVLAIGAIAVTIITGALVGGTWRLAEQNGRLIAEETSCFALALDGAFVGGLAVGRGRRSGRMRMAYPWLGAAVLFICLGLGTVFVKNRQIVAILHDLGLDAPFARGYHPVANKECPGNLTSLYKAIAIYAQDWDALPPAANWNTNDDLVSKVARNEWLHCPAVSNRHDAKFGYAFNDALSGMPVHGKSLKDLPGAAKTPLIYDSSDLGANAHDGFRSLPHPGRHSGRDNVLFLDGHVESIRP